MGEIQLCVAQGRGLASVHIKLPTWTVGYFIKLMKSTAVLVGCTKQMRTGLTDQEEAYSQMKCNRISCGVGDQNQVLLVSVPPQP